MKFHIEFLLIPLIVAEVNGHRRTSRPVKSSRDGKFLSLLTIVRFPNDVCNGTSMNGTCYTSAECTSRGGTNDGPCASGYGVCCAFFLGCGETGRENNTYFKVTQSSSFSGSCKARICQSGDNICQLRLDFETFVITGPDSSKTVAMILNGSPATTGGVQATLSTRCLTDSFSVISSCRSNGPPTVCGTLSGEHMYVDVNRDSPCVDLDFQMRAGNEAVDRAWSIKASQFSCGFPNLAPVGCTQYFFGPENLSGFVKSFNFDGGQHLAGQNQVICVRRERGQCRICWTTMNVEDFAISGMIGGADDVKKCCGYDDGGMGNLYDCVRIPGAMKMESPFDPLPIGFCAKSVGLVTMNSPQGTTVCSSSVPFRVSFTSDQFEVDEEASKGFKLAYFMDGKCTTT